MRFHLLYDGSIYYMRFHLLYNGSILLYDGSIYYMRFHILYEVPFYYMMVPFII